RSRDLRSFPTRRSSDLVTNDSALAARMRNFQATCSWPRMRLAAQYLVKFVVYWLLTEPHVHRVSRVAYERFGRRNPLPVPTTLEDRKSTRLNSSHVKIS